MSIDVEEYKKNPDVCPFCHSEDITAKDWDANYINAWRDVRCRTCNKEWQEEFTLTQVYEYDEEGDLI